MLWYDWLPSTLSSRSLPFLPGQVIRRDDSVGAFRPRPVPGFSFREWEPSSVSSRQWTARWPCRPHDDRTTDWDGQALPGDRF